MRTGKDFEIISIKMVQYAIKNTLKQKIGKSQQEREAIKKNLMKILELKKKKNEQIKNSAGRVTPTEGTRVPGTPQPLSPQMRPHCDPCSRPLPGAPAPHSPSWTPQQVYLCPDPGAAVPSRTSFRPTHSTLGNRLRENAKRKR